MAYVIESVVSDATFNGGSSSPFSLAVPLCNVGDWLYYARTYNTAGGGNATTPSCNGSAMTLVQNLQVNSRRLTVFRFKVVAGGTNTITQPDSGDDARNAFVLGVYRVSGLDPTTPNGTPVTVSHDGDSVTTVVPVATTLGRGVLCFVGGHDRIASSSTVQGGATADLDLDDANATAGNFKSWLGLCHIDSDGTTLSPGWTFSILTPLSAIAFEVIPPGAAASPPRRSTFINRRRRLQASTAMVRESRTHRQILTAVSTGDITAQALATLPPLTTASATATVLLAAQATATMPGLSTTTSTVAVLLQANAVATMPALSASASAALEVHAQSVASMPTLSSSAAGVLLVQVNAIATMPALSSIATVKTNNDTIVTGLATMPPLSTITTTATVLLTANAIATMPALVSVASASLPIVAASIAAMPTLTALASAALPITAQAIALLPLLHAITSIIVGKTTALDGRVFVYPQLSGRVRILPS